MAPDLTLDAAKLNYVGDFSDDSDFDENDLVLIGQMEEMYEQAPIQGGSRNQGIPQMTEHVEELQDIPIVYTVQDAATLLASFISIEAFTKEQENMNRDIVNLQTSRLNDVSNFLNEVHHKLSSLLPNQQGLTQVKDWTKFLARCNEVTNSDEHIQLCAAFIPNKLLSGKIVIQVRKDVTTQKAQGTPSVKCASRDTDESLLSEQRHVSVSGQSKVRYVGGRSIAKVKYHNMNRVRSDLDRSGHIHDQVSLTKVSLLQTLTVSQATIMETTGYPDSLIDISRKQNLSNSLTNITDRCFEFFEQLECARIPLYDISNVNSNILKTVREKLQNSSQLHKLWCGLFTGIPTQTQTCAYEHDVGVIMDDIVTTTASICELFQEITESYLRVADAEFRRKLLAALGKKKTMEHRKKVLSKQSSSGMPGTSRPSHIISFDSIQQDASSDKASTHQRIRDGLTVDKTILRNFTKLQLRALGSSYALQVSLSLKKEELMSRVVAKIQGPYSRNFLAKNFLVRKELL